MNQELNNLFYKILSDNTNACKECNKKNKNPNDKTLYNHDFLIGKVKKPEMMFAMQNPGISQKEEPIKLKKSKKGISYFLKQHDKRFKEWISNGDHKVVMEKLFKILKKSNLITNYENNIKDYLDNYFFYDFYLTDVARCRSTTPGNKNLCSYCFPNFRDELRIVKPKIILLFSARSWNAFRNDAEIQLDKEIKSKPVTDVHGDVIEAKYRDLNFLVIPLIHFTNQGHGNCPKDSYEHYLKKSLNKNENQKLIRKYLKN